MAEDIAIAVNDVSKSFILPHEKQSFIKSSFITLGKTKRGFERQHVLNGISFNIKKGEFFGIVGRNGSGKSTLLKLLAEIYIPDKGEINISGSLTPFIELGVGFNHELSGRENVYLNGALLGFSRSEVDSMYDEIVEFAELERFMDQKLKNYSSGMQVRLAFSIAIRANTDILVLDEVLAVGDAAFQAKCQEYFMDVKNKHKTIVLVTHDMSAVEKYCDRALLLEAGKVLNIGNPKTIADKYLDLNRSSQEKNLNKADNKPKNSSDEDYIDTSAHIVHHSTMRQGEKKCKTYKYLDSITLKVEYEVTQSIKDAVLDIGLTLGEKGQTYFYTNTDNSNQRITAMKGSRIVASVKFTNIYAGGVFHMYSSIYNPNTLEVYARNRNITKIAIQDPPLVGVAVPEHMLTITYTKSKKENNEKG
jgi:ABC-2 type transport system ATP-binding protein